MLRQILIKPQLLKTQRLFLSSKSSSSSSTNSQLAKTSSSSSVPKKTVQSTEVDQAPNYKGTWSVSQQEKKVAFDNPRFLQTDLSAQPNPLAAIELINKQPIIKVTKRIAVCDGGGGALGHPKVYINLDDSATFNTCGYCGLRFQLEEGHDH